MLLSVPVWVLREILDLAKHVSASRIMFFGGYETGDGTYRFSVDLEFGVSESEASTVPHLLKAMSVERNVDGVKLTIVPESLQIYTTGAARISLTVKMEKHSEG